MWIPALFRSASPGGDAGGSSLLENYFWIGLIGIDLRLFSVGRTLS